MTPHDPANLAPGTLTFIADLAERAADASEDYGARRHYANKARRARLMAMDTDALTLDEVEAMLSGDALS